MDAVISPETGKKREDPFLIATLPPVDDHSAEIASHPLVNGLRFNTIMRSPWSKRRTLETLKTMCDGKPLWIDLKARQLRVSVSTDSDEEGCIILNHKIKLKIDPNSPPEIRFRDFALPIRAVRGNEVFVGLRPPGQCKEGMAVNISDPSLEILDGPWTNDDYGYAEAAAKLGLHDVMLSFFQTEKDLEPITAVNPKARPVAKLEDEKGLDFLKERYALYKKVLRLMVPRDDLFSNIGPNKFAYLGLEKKFLEEDPNAIVASRILTSLEHKGEVSLGDIKDMVDLYKMGYRYFMLSDGLCRSPHAFRAAMQQWADFLEFIKGK